MYAQLGSIQFELIKAPNKFSRSLGQNFAEHALINSKPKLQQVGGKLETITISIKFHAAFCNPSLETDNILDIIRAGEVLSFVTGNGDYLGEFVIRECTIDTNWQASDFTVLATQLNLSLTEYFISDKYRHQKEKDIKSAFAVKTTDEISEHKNEEVQEKDQPNPSLDTKKDIVKSSKITNKIIKKINSFLLKINIKVGDIKDFVNNIFGAVKKIKKKIDKAKKYFEIAKEVYKDPEKIKNHIGLIQNVLLAFNIDIGGVSIEAIVSGEVNIADLDLGDMSQLKKDIRIMLGTAKNLKGNIKDLEVSTRGMLVNVITRY